MRDSAPACREPGRPAGEIVAVVPAYNEAGRIGDTVAAIREGCFAHRVIVVDDGSGDDTARRAADAGAEVVRLPRNTGKGGALNAVLMPLAQEQPRPAAVVLLDADLGVSAALAGALVKPVLAGEADLVIGVLPAQGGGGFGLVKRLAAWIVRRQGGRVLAQPLSGQRAISGRALPQLLPLGRGFSMEILMDLDAMQAGLRIKEVPVSFYHAITGRDWRGFCHRACQFRDLLWAWACYGRRWRARRRGASHGLA
ncbi:MAG: glycosyltransferase family 2 protein [Firmicutes bacterium]|nr:glycosyltransferase family 2 protein [Bacillota bacterium]